MVQGTTEPGPIPVNCPRKDSQPHCDIVHDGLVSLQRGHRESRWRFLSVLYSHCVLSPNGSCGAENATCLSHLWKTMRGNAELVMTE